MRRLLILVLLLPMSMAVAGEPDRVGVDAGRPAGLAGRLPQGTVKRIAASPESFVERAAAIILGYGQDGRIDAAGIEASIALDRAESRAIALRRMLSADLDNEGTLAADEVRVRALALPPKDRATLLRNWQTADRDGSGRVDAEELRALAQEAAVKYLSDRAAEERRSLLLFDGDADAAVTVAEVERGVAVVARDAAQAQTEP